MANEGGSFLAEAAGAADAGNGTPADGGMGNAAPVDGANEAIEDAMDGPPEWAPKKYWNPDKRQLEVEELAKGYVNLEKLLGREKVPLPTDDEDQEGWERVYKAIGRPEKPDEYQFNSPELPEDLPYDKEAEQNFRTWAHVNGLNKKQAANLYDGYVKHQLERHAAWHKQQQDYRRELEGNLQREYGNKLESVKQRAGLIIRENADPEFHQYLTESGLGNDPRMVRFLDRVGQKLVGETKLKGTPKVAEAEPQDYQRAIADYREKHKEALFNRDHPNHELRVKEFNRLFEGAFGTEPANRF
jgi:hypothetical protein